MAQKKERHWTIYCLIDPRTALPFYVGRTQAPLRRRYDHTHRAWSALRGQKSLFRRVREIRDAGMRPSFAIIERTLDPAREDFHIRRLAKMFALVNSASNQQRRAA
jgi:hypothetical protein